MSAQPLLTVHGLSKSYGALSAISDVSFHVNTGEILGLIGPNGAGKTTLFECLAGVQPASSGSLRGPDQQTLDAHGRAATMFYVPDGIRPYPEQPLGWVLNFALGFFGGHRERACRTIEQLHLVDLLRQPVGVLSKGQAKRAMLAFGLLTPQPLLMIDEPFEGLDLRQTRETAAALREHADAGRTLFLSIHQINDAARVCDRLVLLSGGRKRGEGTGTQLMAQCDAVDLEEAFLALT